MYDYDEDYADFLANYDGELEDLPTEREQIAMDRNQYANEMVRLGKWDKDQAAEYKAGA